MSLKSVPELLDAMDQKSALCAFNVESLETLKGTIRAAADLQTPVVVEMTAPAAERLELELCQTICDAYARHYGAQVALHLDHCDDRDGFVKAVQAGFTSGNFLGEGMSWNTYVEGCRSLRAELDGQCSFEFVYGELGYAHDHDHGTGEEPVDISPEAELARIEQFVADTRPHLFSFDFGSLHGMNARSQNLQLDKLRTVVDAVQLPIVLHGSSGVRHEQVLASIDAGVRKINIESAVRKSHTDALTSFMEAGNNVGKPRHLSQALEAGVYDLCSEMLTRYTLRKDG